MSDLTRHQRYFMMRKESACFRSFCAGFEPSLGLFAPSRQTTACTRLQSPALQFAQRLQKIDPQGRPGHVRLRLGRPKVASTAEVKPSLHRPQAFNPAKCY